MLKVNKRESGQSLVEIIVALALASLVALGLVKITTTSVKGSRYSSDQSKMTALAQKQIAKIVDHENQDTRFWEGGTHYYPAGFPQEEYSTDGYCLHTTVTDETAQLVPATGKMAKINVKVFWDEKGVGTQCWGLNYTYSLSFDTYVTN